MTSTAIGTMSFPQTHKGLGYWLTAPKHQLVRPEEKFCGLTSMTHGILPTMRRSVPLQGYRRRLGFVSDAVGERADDAR